MKTVSLAIIISLLLTISCYNNIVEASGDNNLNITMSAEVLSGGIRLSWSTDLSNPKLMGYNIYRGLARGKEEAEPVNVNVILVKSGYSTLSYTDYIAEKGIYFYICKAVFKDGSISGQSNEATAYITDVSKNISLIINNPYMTVNGEKKEIDPGRGTVPVIKGNRTLVAIRSLLNVLGCKTLWNADKKQITIKQGANSINLWIGNKEAVINGVHKTLDVAPQIINERTMLPLRFISENLGCHVEWDKNNNKIKITL